MKRIGEIERKTKETQVKVKINLDGEGKGRISTGIPFFDHMLDLLTYHSLFDLEVEAVGDIEVDFHHTVEDVGITLGEALKEALGNKEGIERYGWTLIPMDESLALVSIDFSSRPLLVFRGEIKREKVGVFDSELLKVFLQSFSVHAGITLHVNLLYGENSHHCFEAIFKALGRALHIATRINKERKGVPSSKGIL